MILVIGRLETRRPISCGLSLGPPRAWPTADRRQGSIRPAGCLLEVCWTFAGSFKHPHKPLRTCRDQNAL